MTVVWLTGLPATGKTTVARVLRSKLLSHDRCVVLLDSDDLREILTPQPTYSDEERDRFYGALGRIAELVSSGGAVVLVAATAPKRAYRDAVRARVDRFIEVLLIADWELLEARDPKGLFAMAKAGLIDRLPGCGAPYEDPRRPEMVFDTGDTPAEQIAEAILEHLERDVHPIPQRRNRHGLPEDHRGRH